jgi:hypothetical protein
MGEAKAKRLKHRFQAPGRLTHHGTDRLLPARLFHP